MGGVVKMGLDRFTQKGTLAGMGDSGFSLIEIMIAMFIFAVGILAVSIMFDTSFRYGGGAKTLNIANRLTQTTMEQLSSYGYQNVLNDMPDRNGTPGSNYTVATSGGVTTKTNWEYRDRSLAVTTNASEAYYTLTVEVKESYVVDAGNAVTANKVLVTVVWSDSGRPNRQVQYETYL